MKWDMVYLHEPQRYATKIREKFRTKAEAEAFVRSVEGGGIPISCNNKEIGRVAHCDYVLIDPFDEQWVVGVTCYLWDFTMPAAPVQTFEIEEEV